MLVGVLHSSWNLIVELIKGLQISVYYFNASRICYFRLSLIKMCSRIITLKNKYASFCSMK